MIGIGIEIKNDGENKKTAKGVIREVKENQITHEDFKTRLHEKKELHHTGTKIIQEKHRL